jgi:hypothetical protein
MKIILACLSVILFITLFVASCSRGISSTIEREQTTLLPENFIYFLPIETKSSSSLVISGKVPPNISVSIINITMAGSEIISGNADNEGVFRFQISDDIKGCRIGLVVNGNFDSSQYQPGNNAMNVPQIGYFWDTLVIH